ncbi:hypothetical protein P7F60_30765, partial [Rhizobium sp. YJ-22]|uniref:hypothetical protein n=1 Tax=Rhizobium sp. YJ-22 TaxID=3037556 RepID=UPI002412ADE1
QLLEIDPRMRGQATSTKPSVRQRPKPSNNQRSLSDTSFSFGKPILFAHAQRGAEPPVRINLLFTMYAEQALFPYGKRKPFFLPKTTCRSRAAGAPRGRQTIGDAPCACESLKLSMRGSIGTIAWWS